MKNYKDLVSEVAQPKAPEEKRFKDQHTIEVIPHPVAPDHVFTGEIPGLTDGKRLADVDNAEADYDKAYKSKVDQTLPQRGTGQGKPVAEDSNIVKKSITEILGVNKKKKDDKKDDESMEEKVTCPKCEGKGCDHCDGNGYHESVDLEEMNARYEISDMEQSKDPAVKSAYAKLKKAKYPSMQYIRQYKEVEAALDKSLPANKRKK